MAISGPPLWKGTFFFNLDTGGFTESLYTGAGGPNTFGTVRDAMLACLPARLKLSQTIDMAATGVCVNPVVPIGIRVTRLDTKRATFTDTAFSVVARSYRTTTLTPQQLQEQTTKIETPDQTTFNVQDVFQNDSPNVAAKVLFTDLNGHNVNYLLHGFPNAAMDNDYTKLPISGYTRRLADVAKDWVTNLWKYSDKIIQQNLGFRFNVNIWVPRPDHFVPPEAGDSRPSQLTGATPQYDPVTGYYTFYMSQALPAAKTRVILRGFKKLNFLNGRWVAMQLPSVVIGTTTLYPIQIQVPARDNLPWDNAGTISPETFNLMVPVPSSPVGQQGIPGASFDFITSKKIGRPFEVERGRISRRRR